MTSSAAQSIQPQEQPMSDLEQWCAELRTADGIKRQLMRTDNSHSTMKMLVDLLYAQGRLDGLREASERVAL